MKYKRYPKYKDSGVEWIGEIPKEWGVIKLKQITKFSLGLVNNPSHYFDENGKIPMITGKNVKFTGLVLSNTDLITEESNFQLKGSQIFSDDIVSMRVGYAGRSAVVSSSAHGINCASLLITRGSKNHNSHFICYVLNSPVGRVQTMMLQNGMAQQVVNLGSWKNFIVPLPEKHEQDQIAEFLDEKITRFDKLIAKSKAQITLLEEKRQATINQAVTKGLDPSVPMKDSGVEWIGDIPEHWNLKRVKFITKIIYGESLPDEKRIIGDVPVYGSNGIIGYHNESISTSNTIIIGRKGSVGEINYSKESCFPMDTAYYIDKNSTDHNLEWLFYALQSLGLTELNKDSVVPGLSREEVYNLKFPILEKEEKQIANYLNEKTKKIDSLISKVELQITKLQEFRESLILSVVTGKIKVTQA